MRREIEIAILIAGIYICLAAGFKVADINYKLFLYMLSGIFALAIFRPKHLP